jgi:hypothetical protein
MFLEFNSVWKEDVGDLERQKDMYDLYIGFEKEKEKYRADEGKEEQR